MKVNRTTYSRLKQGKKPYEVVDRFPVCEFNYGGLTAKEASDRIKESFMIKAVFPNRFLSFNQEPKMEYSELVHIDHQGNKIR